MTVTVANTANTNTFDYWRNRTNEVADAISTKAITTVGVPTGNASVNGFFIATGFRAANSTSNVTITVPNTVMTSSGSYNLNANGQWASVVTSYGNTVTTTNTSQQVIDSYTIASTNAAEYIIAARTTTTNNYSVTKLMTMHAVGNAYSSEYASVQSNGVVGSFTVDSNTTHVRLLYTPVSNSVVTFTRVSV